MDTALTAAQIAEAVSTDEAARGLPSGAVLGTSWFDANGVEHLYVNEPGTGNIVDALAIPTASAGDPSASDDGWVLDPSGLFWQKGAEVRPWKPYAEMTPAEVVAFDVASGVLDPAGSNDLNPKGGAGPTQTGLEALDILSAAKVNPLASPAIARLAEQERATAPSAKPLTDPSTISAPNVSASVGDVPATGAVSTDPVPVKWILIGLVGLLLLGRS